MSRISHAVDQLEDLVAGNEIILARTKGIGVLPLEVAAAFGVSGPNLRASGVAFDIRKVENYLPYDKFDFDIPKGENGDSWDRWWVRLEEIRQSVRIVEQAIEGIPSGPLQAKVPKVIKIPAGRPMSGPRIRRGKWATTWCRTAPGPISAEDPLGKLLQHLDSSLDPRRRPGAGHHLDHGIVGFRPRRCGQIDA